jgi:hypothetical protein
LFFVLWAVENSAATRSHFQAIIHATNWQKTQTIASQPSQLILIESKQNFQSFIYAFNP